MLAIANHIGSSLIKLQPADDVATYLNISQRLRCRKVEDTTKAPHLIGGMLCIYPQDFQFQNKILVYCNKHSLSNRVTS